METLHVDEYGWGESRHVDRNNTLEISTTDREYHVVEIKKGETHFDHYPKTTLEEIPRTMVNNKTYTDYEAKVRDARARFGPTTQVVYQVGSFYMMMSIEDGLIDIEALTACLGTHVCKVDRANPVVSRDNYLMIGWPEAHNDRMVARLRAQEYHVVVVKRTQDAIHEEVILTDRITSMLCHRYSDYESKMLQAKRQWGEKAVVIYKVGDFYQILSIEDGLVDIRRIASLLDCQIMKCDKRNPTVDRDNYLMIGWPVAFNTRMMDTLHDHDFHVVMLVGP